MNVNFTVGSHYCGGEKVLTKVMLERSALECGMEWLKSECDKAATKKCKHQQNNSHSDSFSKTDCCQTVYQTVSPDIELAFDNYTTSFNPVFASVFIETAVSFNFTPKVEFNYHNFYPPPLKRSLSILFQVFRL